MHINDTHVSELETEDDGWGTSDEKDSDKDKLIILSMARTKLFIIIFYKQNFSSAPFHNRKKN